jgi:hypothetical protein
MLRCCALLLAASRALAAPFHLASIFGPNMVMQRNAPATFWGWAAPGTTVFTSLVDGNTSQQVSALADASGLWSAAYPPQNASGFTYRFFAATSDVDIERCLQYQFYCSGASLSLSPLAFGDVVECIGQSNSAWSAQCRLGLRTGKRALGPLFTRHTTHTLAAQCKSWWGLPLMKRRRLQTLLPFGACCATFRWRQQ